MGATSTLTQHRPYEVHRGRRILNVGLFGCPVALLGDSASSLLLFSRWLVKSNFVVFWGYLFIDNRCLRHHFQVLRSRILNTTMAMGSQVAKKGLQHAVFPARAVVKTYCATATMAWWRDNTVQILCGPANIAPHYVQVRRHYCLERLEYRPSSLELTPRDRIWGRWLRTYKM